MAVCRRSGNIRRKRSEVTEKEVAEGVAVLLRMFGLERLRLVRKRGQTCDDVFVSQALRTGRRPTCSEIRMEI
jgi:hypothetical protein